MSKPLNPLSLSTQTEYQAAVDYLYARINYERTVTTPYNERQLKLARMRELLQQLGEPQKKIPTVHIAGTKGKGSTCAMVAKIAQAAGLRVGLFTSPHLHHIEERFTVNQTLCSQEDFTKMIGRLRPILSTMDQTAAAQGHTGEGPTFFELITALGWLHFVQQKCDLVVLEVGLGGRLDSTNVCHPNVTAITSIGYDHTQQLGNTLALIAAEKAGILKPGVPVISGVLSPTAQNVVREVAKKLACPLVELNQDYHYKYTPPVLVDSLIEEKTHTKKKTLKNKNSFAGTLDFKMHGRQLTNLQLALPGKHQGTNAAMAVAILETLQHELRHKPQRTDARWQISETAIRRGLATTRLAARVEILETNPLLIRDSAHNVPSIEALTQTLDEIYPTTLQAKNKGQKILVLATSKDKDTPGICLLVAKYFDHIIATHYHKNPRAVPAEKLGEILKEHNAKNLQVLTQPHQALEAARQLATPHALICVTGSFFLAAEAFEDTV